MESCQTSFPAATRKQNIAKLTWDVSPLTLQELVPEK